MPDDSNGTRTRALSFVDTLVRHRALLLAIYVLHSFLIHYFVLGLVTWDALGYRGSPIVELVQHGSFGFEKYYDWAYLGYIPFVELVNAPFVYLFGMAGFIMGFPLVLFPFCVWAVHAMVRELTGDRRAGVFGGIAYAAIPWVNQQPYSGYIDFAVCGFLAFFVYAVLRLRSDERWWASALRLVVATALLTMSRAQGIYVVIVLLPLLSYGLFMERQGFRLRFTAPRALALAIAAVVIGAAPAIAVQVVKFVRHGTPTFPVQFSILGFKTAAGIPMTEYYKYAGLADGSLPSLLKGFYNGWIWTEQRPLGGWFSSKYFGGGLMLYLAAALFVPFVRRATRVELWLLLGCVVVSLLAKDFAVPRYSYTLVIALSLVIGRGMVALLSEPRWHRWFWVVCIVLGVHLARPEIDLVQFRLPGYNSPRLNVSGSPLFLEGRDSIQPFTDAGATLVVLESNGNSFWLPMYGAKLGNQVAGTILKAAVGERCAGLAGHLERDPSLVFVDDHDLSKNCERECAIRASWGGCRAWRIKLGPPLPPPPQ